ncbi:MAG: CsbD family protein [Cyanobacteria bacterium P01_A01_bin.37]
MITRLNRIKATFLRSVCCALIAACMLMGSLPSAAIAAPTDSADIALSRAGNELERVVGEGTINTVQGRAQEDLGKVERSLGKVTGQAEGTADQLKGRAQRDIGRTQQAIDEAGDTAEETADNLVDSVKDFFGQ